MTVRILIPLVLLTAAVVAVVCFGFLRGRSRADQLMRRVDGNWKRTQTRFVISRWQFYYEAQAKDYRRSAPVVIPTGLLGDLPRRLTISFSRSQPATRFPSDAVHVPREEAYSLSSPFWNQRYTLSLQATKPGKP